ncbi:MAG: GTPase [Hyperionvirus sp.]|uniref:GTPase n=1 Tax=Hyperionvirus sp. TaxID=2487770 RepID=A0A3G5ACF9_9VIRU|nr:MAG: GTPase [Hyperionvirus sp.]
MGIKIEFNINEEVTRIVMVWCVRVMSKLIFRNKIFQNLIEKFDDEDKPCFYAENDEGYMEYKLRLDQIDKGKMMRMITQMTYRLNEAKLLTSKANAYYLLGVDDDGNVGYVSREIIDKSIDILIETAHKCNAEVYSLEIVTLEVNCCLAAAAIRKCYNAIHINEYRISMLGASGHGKTTTLGYLTYNEKDNGTGSSRRIIFRHNHEQTTGITSSIKHDIFGLADGKIYNYRSDTVDVTWDKIAQTSNKIISIFDLPGLPKYYRTMLFGVLVYRAHLNLIIISVQDCISSGIPDETIAALEISLAFKTPIFILFTKIASYDNSEITGADENLLSLVTKLNVILSPTFKLVPCDEPISSGCIPYLPISNITGKNYHKFINYIDKCSPPRNQNIIPTKLSDRSIIDFMICDVYNIKETGYIVLGVCLVNEIHLDDKLFIGPLNGKFYPIIIKSIRKKQIESERMFTDEFGSLEIKMEENIIIDKQMCIIDEKSTCLLSNTINVSLSVMPLLTIGHQYMLFVDNTIETVTLTKQTENIHTFTLLKSSPIYVRSHSKCIIRSDSKTTYGYTT